MPCTGISADQPDAPAYQHNQWFPRNPAQPLRAVALVIHGLNLRPAKMNAVINHLNAAGIDALRVSLSGHGQNYKKIDGRSASEARLETFKTVTYQGWFDETYRAYRQARARSEKEKVPLFFVANSYGSLIGIDVLITKPDVHFDKMVLFAPALKMHRRNHLIRLFSPFPKLVIPSFSPPAYLANKGTPMAAYNTLFETLNHFEKNIQPKINIPTLIFIDPGDELISFSNLEAMVANRPFHQWQIHRVEKTATGKAAKIHHLIIDPESTGGDVWQSMMDRTVRHLLE